MPLTSVSFREPGMPETGLLLQDIAYTYRVWVTLIKRLYAPLRYPKKHPPIFTPLRVYAIGCYLRYCGFPRRSLLGSSVNRGDPLTRLGAPTRVVLKAVLSPCRSLWVQGPLALA